MGHWTFFSYNLMHLILTLLKDCGNLMLVHFERATKKISSLMHIMKNIINLLMLLKNILKI